MVKIGEEWFTLVSVDGIAAEDIVAFSRWTHVDGCGNDSRRTWSKS
jgi:hypothetical protein